MCVKHNLQLTGIYFGTHEMFSLADTTGLILSSISRSTERRPVDANNM
jgi:hypothetical protein